ncbi:MAG TPA: phage holin family protein, partial [Polyangiales bacterium]|nr:phage holin family protein [Polyangiales bacterium]
MANLSSQPPESLPELLRSIADQAQTFVKAEVSLIKLEAQRTVTSAAVALLVLIASGVLLAVALSLLAAGVVLLRGGSVGAAALTAAGVDLVVAV